jgi:feruloyl esterase
VETVLWFPSSGGRRSSVHGCASVHAVVELRNDVRDLHHLTGHYRLISNPRACNFNPETLLCPEADGPNCLTKGQVASLKALYSGFNTKDGKHRTYPRPVGHEAGGWQNWILGATQPTTGGDGRLVFASNPPQGYRYMESGLRYLTLDRDDPTYEFWTFNFDRDGSRLEKMKQILSPADPDLRPFRARNGKLLFYHGWADPALSAYQTVAYFDQVVRTVGGKAQADEFVRLFLAPGMHHCSGGPGPNSFVAETIMALERRFWRRTGIRLDK